jgi:hypothetical protein
MPEVESNVTVHSCQHPSNYLYDPVVTRMP